MQLQLFADGRCGFFRMSPWQTIIGNCKNAASARIVSLAGVQSSETTFCLDQRDVKTVCPDPAKISRVACTCLESNITPNLLKLQASKLMW